MNQFPFYIELTRLSGMKEIYKVVDYDGTFYKLEPISNKKSILIGICQNTFDSDDCKIIKYNEYHQLKLDI